MRSRDLEWTPRKCSLFTTKASMSASRVGRPVAHSWFGSPAYQNINSASHLPLSPPLLCRRHCRYRRTFSSSTRHHEQQQQQQQQRRRASFGSRLLTAWNRTKVEWYPIPVGLGIGFLGFAQIYKVRQRERLKLAEEEKERLENEGQGSGDGKEGRPKKRKRIRPSGPWYAPALPIIAILYADVR